MSTVLGLGKAVFRGIPEAQTQILLAEVDRLLGLLPEDHWSARVHDAAGSLLPERKPVRGPRPALDGLPRLSKGDHPLGSFLQVRPPPDHPRREAIDRLRGFALAATLRFLHETSGTSGASIDESYSSIATGLRAMRRLSAHAKFEALRHALPSIPERIGEVLANLQQFRDGLRLTSSYKAARIEEVYRLLQHLDAYRGVREGPRGPRESSKPLPDFAWSIRPHPGLYDTTPSVLQFLAPPAGLQPEDYPGTREEAADLAEPVMVDLGFADQARDPLEETYADQLDLFVLDTRPAAWLADPAGLDDKICARIMAAAAEAMLKPQPHPGAVFSAACLLWGRRLEELCALNQPQNHPGVSWWSGSGIGYSPDVTGARQKWQNGFIAEGPAPLKIPFDVFLRADANADSMKQQASEWLGLLDLPHRPRLSSLSRALHDGLAARGEDEAVISLLSGTSVKADTRLYYANFQVGRLADAWRSHQKIRLGLPVAGDLTAADSSQRIGSLLAPSETAVRKHFQSLGEAVLSAASRKTGLDAWPDLHAAVTNYCLSVLCFITARRPHGPAFEPFGQITGRKRARVLVSDKGNRLQDDARWLPLPATAMRVIALYRQHLALLHAETLTLLLPETSARIAEAMDGTAPAFFLWPGLDEQPQELKAATFYDRVLPPDRKPRNWARHYLRRKLADEGLAGARIDTFMGHGGSWSDPLLPTSTESLADQEALRAALEGILIRVLGPLPSMGGAR